MYKSIDIAKFRVWNNQFQRLRLLLGDLKFFLTDRMTSLLAFPSQINARTMYLRSIGAATEYTATGTIQSVMTTTAWAAATTSAPGSANIQYRDMGKRVTIVDPVTGIDVEKYAQVQIVSGSGSEGVPAVYNTRLFVRTWSASGASIVSVARIG